MKRLKKYFFLYIQLISTLLTMSLPIYAENSSFEVNGSTIIDPNGDAFVIKGVNIFAARIQLASA